MLKVLLVDDEPYISQGLSVLIDWNKEGFEIVKSAGDGFEALKYLKENSVDLIIADIKMPGMTGIELLEKITEEKLSDAYYVILSGFNDFNYAREAMRFGCMDYLLKPVEKDELIKILHKITDLREETVIQEQYHKRTENAYIQRHLVALLVGKYDDVNLDFIKNNTRYSDGVRYVMFAQPDVDVDDAEESSLMKSRREMNEALEQILGEDSDHIIDDVSLNHSSYDLGFVYCDYMAEEKGLGDVEYLSRLQKMVEDRLGRRIRVLAGKMVQDITQISKSYSTACILKSQEVFHDQKKVIIYEKELSINPGKAHLFKKSVDNLIDAIEQNDHMLIRKCVTELYDDIGSAGVGNSVSLNMNYMLFQLIHIASKQDDELDQEEILHRISESSFTEGITRGSSKHMYQFACEYAEYLSQLQKNISHDILGRVEEEIKEHFDENLSLRKMSEKYYINCSYLGLLFRKKYGESFKDYLTTYRINEAAKLLVNTNDRIVDISARVGYKNSDYFIRKFIERKGSTPSQYRRQNRSSK